MKLVFLILAAAPGAIGLCDLCGTSAAPTRPSAARATALRLSAVSAAAVDTVVLQIEGMTCGGCTLATRKVLERLDGVSKANVGYERKRAVVTYDPAKVTVAQMIAAVATLKYTARVVRPGATTADRS